MAEMCSHGARLLRHINKSLATPGVDADKVNNGEASTLLATHKKTCKQCQIAETVVESVVEDGTEVVAEVKNPLHNRRKSDRYGSFEHGFGGDTASAIKAIERMIGEEAMVGQAAYRNDSHEIMEFEGETSFKTRREGDIKAVASLEGKSPEERAHIIDSAFGKLGTARLGKPGVVRDSEERKREHSDATWLKNMFCKEPEPAI